MKRKREIAKAGRSERERGVMRLEKQTISGLGIASKRRVASEKRRKDAYKETSLVTKCASAISPVLMRRACAC